MDSTYGVSTTLILLDATGNAATGNALTAPASIILASGHAETVAETVADTGLRNYYLKSLVKLDGVEMEKISHINFINKILKSP